MDFSDNEIPANDFVLLANSFASFQHGIDTLRFRQCNLGPRSIAHFFDVLERCYPVSLTIRCLDLSQNKFEEIGQ
jgi:hypothetical protein